MNKICKLFALLTIFLFAGCEEKKEINVEELRPEDICFYHVTAHPMHFGRPDYSYVSKVVENIQLKIGKGSDYFLPPQMEGYDYYLCGVCEILHKEMLPIQSARYKITKIKPDLFFEVLQRNTYFQAE